MFDVINYRKVKNNEKSFKYSACNDSNMSDRL